MKTFTTEATLVKQDGNRYVGRVQLSTRDDGLAEGTFETDNIISGLGNAEFTLQFHLDGQVATARSAVPSKISTEGFHTLVEFRAQSIEIDRPADASRVASITYRLTNLKFDGSMVTQIGGPTSASFRKDHHNFSYKQFNVIVRQVPGYDTVIEELRSNRGVAVTAEMTIDLAWPGSANESDLDNFAQSVCELLSLATKNTVQWVQKSITTSEGASLGWESQRVANLRPFISGWALIPDAVAMTGTPGFRFELLYFLNSCIGRYFETMREGGLQLAIAWKLDSEHQQTIDMQYIAAFICIEWMKSKLLPSQARPAAILSADWQNAVSGGLGERFLQELESFLGKPPSELQRVVFLNGLRSANNPPIAEQMKALCSHFGITGFEKEMADFRSKLVHTGAYGQFDFHDAIRLLRRLSHLIDQIILAALGYDGYYIHWDTNWNPTKFPPS